MQGNISELATEANETEGKRPCDDAATSLPLDRSGRLRAHVVDDAIYARHLVADAARDSRQDIMGKGEPVSSHAVRACDCAKTKNILVGSLVAHHSHAAYRQQHGERLPNRVVQSRGPNFLEVDRISLAKDVELRLGHITQHAYRETWPREWMAANHFFG